AHDRGVRPAPRPRRPAAPAHRRPSRPVGRRWAPARAGSTWVSTSEAPRPGSAWWTPTTGCWRGARPPTPARDGRVRARASYGRITLFSLPRARTVFGPTQIHAQILADPEVSKELTLFNQQGSTVILGNLLTVPIKDSLLYVQPIFVQASQGAIPELRRVPVFFNNQLGYTANL